MIPKPLRGYPLLVVEWEDASSSTDTGWRDVVALAGAERRGYVCWTTGFLLRESATHLTLVQSLGLVDESPEDLKVAALFTIPKAMIRRRRTLGTPFPPKKGWPAA